MKITPLAITRACFKAYLDKIAPRWIRCWLKTSTSAAPSTTHLIARRTSNDAGRIAN